MAVNTQKQRAAGALHGATHVVGEDSSLLPLADALSHVERNSQELFCRQVQALSWFRFQSTPWEGTQTSDGVRESPKDQNAGASKFSSQMILAVRPKFAGRVVSFAFRQQSFQVIDGRKSQSTLQSTGPYASSCTLKS
jgi:hypothetical protein